MNSITIFLPQGMQTPNGEWTKEVELEEMTGEEEDILANSETTPGGHGVLAKSSSRRTTEILSRCTKRIGKEGRPAGKDRFNLPDHFVSCWEKAFTNDRGFTLIRLRQLSLGDVYAFQEDCPKCGKELKRVTVALNELEVTDAPIEKFASTDGTFTTELPSGRVVRWRTLRGTDEDLIQEIAEGRKSDLVSAMLFSRIVSINGDRPKFEDLRKMNSRERSFLRNQMDAEEAGIDTSIVILCDNTRCRNVFKKSMNVGRPDFFFPSEMPVASKETSSA